MELAALIANGKENGASDLHLEASLPAALRIRGSLKAMGEPLSAKALQEMAENLLDMDALAELQTRRSVDLSRTVAGVRCRINVFHTSRGVGMAIRLLSNFQATVDRLNLHPELKKLAQLQNGLILVSGPTGSGKTSTLAALIQEINLSESRHIVTIENPIEYHFQSRRAFIRQREVGRDTPSFERGLLDALREDPDVVMVGEMREPETMRLTLDASETGHLVLSTVHSSNCIEALQRVISAFSGDIQNNIAAQLADCVTAVISQRLKFRPDLNIRVPECEILIPSYAIRNFIRTRDFFKIKSALETGAEQGCWTFARYQRWLETKSQWFIQGKTELAEAEAEAAPEHFTPRPRSEALMPSPPPLPKASAPGADTGARIEIQPVEGGLEQLIKKLT